MYYKPSGKYTAGGPPLMLFFSVPAALLFGAVYGYFLYYNPFHYINFLAALWLGALISVATWPGAKIGKVRAGSLGYILGAISGAIGLYTHWVVWLHNLLRESQENVWPLAPTQLLNELSLVANEGTWSIFSITPSGIVVWMVWLLEAVIIVGSAAIGSAYLIESAPFCERCQMWVSEKLPSFNLGPAPLETENLKERLEAGDLQVFSELGAETELCWTEFTIMTCPRCSQLGFLTAKYHTKSLDGNGIEKTKVKTLVNNLQLLPNAMEEVIRHHPIEKL